MLAPDDGVDLLGLVEAGIVVVPDASSSSRALALGFDQIEQPSRFRDIGITGLEPLVDGLKPLVVSQGFCNRN